MAQLLPNSMFHRVFFPPEADGTGLKAGGELRLQRMVRFQPDDALRLADASIVVFDFETTGLNTVEDRIVEVGAIRIKNFGEVEQFVSLVRPDVDMSRAAGVVTGITSEMLADAPAITKVLPEFLEFIQGSILVAHNAEFDMGFLKAACLREGIELQWPSFCTLKMARALLPALESKGLDALARHYELTFEARHRSIGDVRVTCQVMEKLWEAEARELKTWKDVAPFVVA